MRKKMINQDYSFAILFSSLLSVIIISPFLLDLHYGELMINILAVMVVMVPIHSISGNKRNFMALLAIATAIIVCTLLKEQHINFYYILMHQILSFIFCGLVALMILKLIFEKEEITRDLLFAALGAYLMIGFAFGYLYQFIEFLLPHSFVYNNDYDSGLVYTYDLIYFSFSVLSTVGFGDIVPANSYSRAIVIIEEITGVFYLAVLVSRLVGSMAHRKRDE